MERSEWLKIQSKYAAYAKDRGGFASNQERDDDLIQLLAQICDELWKLRNKQP